MTEYPNLSRAPIQEVVLDIHVELPAGVGTEALHAFGEAVRDEYPTWRPITEVATRFGFAQDTISSDGRFRELGRIYWNADQTRAVQCRVNGFSVNHLRPYASWDSLQSTARRLWAVYAAAATPRHITRCALRYINRIAVPTGIDLRNTLRTPVEVAPGLPQQVSEYFVRLTLPFGDRAATVIQATVPDDTSPGNRAFALDIDVSSDAPIALDGSALWSEFDALRDIKNRCFFETLTSNAIEAYR